MEHLLQLFTTSLLSITLIHSPGQAQVQPPPVDQRLSAQMDTTYLVDSLLADLHSSKAYISEMRPILLRACELSESFKEDVYGLWEELHSPEFIAYSEEKKALDRDLIRVDLELYAKNVVDWLTPSPRNQ